MVHKKLAVFIGMTLFLIVLAACTNQQQVEKIDEATRSEIGSNQLIQQEEDEIPVDPGREQNIF